jgi:hypothetical protein
MIFLYIFDELFRLFCPKLIEIATEPMFSIGELIFLAFAPFKWIHNEGLIAYHFWESII